MLKLSSYWAFFAHAQRTANHHQIDHRYWAADEAADATLELITATQPAPLREIADKIQVLAGNRAAKHRHRSRSLVDIFTPAIESIILPSQHAKMIAREELNRIRALVSPADWRLLEMVALGENHAEIAKALGLAEGTVKNRLSQLRRRLLN